MIRFKCICAHLSRSYFYFVTVWRRQNSNCEQRDHEFNENIKLRTWLFGFVAIYRERMQSSHVYLNWHKKDEKKRKLFTYRDECEKEKNISIDEKKVWFVNSRFKWIECTAQQNKWKFIKKIVNNFPRVWAKQKNCM